eukprot:CAMPEP_0176421854 /NCGR_PEP_ID=MMETSP0127-20121128/9412_1 /TAXON_ID=938130 /ORGANISM="Platyophrya macrostoma, Strain WH" /LENGTH=421 /DNA_ID=CAMNT_0017802645 /DNA_START=21 /DNA_END=1286 /DNA_ORIENTATION=+
MPNKEVDTNLTSKPVDTVHEPEKKRAFHSKQEKPAALFSTLPYYSILGLYFLVYILIEKYHQPWTAGFIVFVLLPVCDYVFSEDWLNPNSTQTKKLDDDVLFKIPLYLTVIVDWCFYFWVLNHLCAQPFNLYYCGGVLFITGILLATNIVVAHELFHKHDFLGRFVGGFTLVRTLYTHFFIEHQYGHHRNVATPEDPATSRYGESFYAYLPRAVFGSYASAWEIEKKRLINIEECSTHWHPKNRMIWYTLGYFVYPAIICKYFGFYGMILSLYLAFQAVIFLEGIDYIEHYGLERKEIAPGEYEKVNIKHSWNAPHRITNYILFKLQRHSDHHENGYKPYQTLATYDESPMLPNGYAFCIMMGYFPHFWFKVMDPCLMAYRKGGVPTPEQQAEANKHMLILFTLVSTVFGALSLIGYIRPY